MNKLLFILTLTVSSVTFLALTTLFLSVLNLINPGLSFVYLPLANINITIIFYLMGLSLLSAYVTSLLISKFVEESHPLQVESIEVYFQFAKDIGLLVENKDVQKAIREREEQLQHVQDEFQCELELLLNELHRLLIASWFDCVSPQDPDFPRATRQAFARAAIELQDRAAAIKPDEAAEIILTLIVSHVRNVKHHSGNNRLTPLEDGSAERVLTEISEALVSTLLPQEISAPPGGSLLASLLAHGALCRALALVCDPGWLCMQLAQVISGESRSQDAMVSQQPEDVEDATTSDIQSSADADMDAVQEACTPSDDTPELLTWPSELGSTPKLWGTCSLQPEQPSLPQIVEPSETTRKNESSMFPLTRKASEAEWLNPSPPRQHLGLQLSKSSHDLSQASSRDSDNLRNIAFSAAPTPTLVKEMSLGSYMRGETSLFGSKVREAGNDVLGSLRARATSLLSPARETPASLPVEEDDSVSPVYEEASDLASSIAKLRALLKNHDHKSSTDEESDIQAPMWERPAQVENSDCDWMEAEEAPELPDDGRPFMNISIPSTEVSVDSSGQQFVQYCIQYDAVYVQEREEGPRLVLETTSVKRRFQEFLNLQNRLEETPVYRSALRAVKGPSRWLSLAFSKAGQQTTASRLPVLERFLQQLCEQPVLARSPALRNFLAYGSHRTTEFNKQPSDMPRLDKILARTVSGVFHSIKTALPSFDFELSPANSVQQLQCGDEELSRTSSLPSFLGLNRAQPRVNIPLVFMEKPSQAKDVCRDVNKFLSGRIETASEAWSEDSISNRKVSLAFLAMPMIAEKNHENKENKHESATNESTGDHLMRLVEDLLHELLPECWLVSGSLPQTLRTLLQHWTEQKLQSLAEQMWSLHSAVCLLRLCRAALAPNASVLHATKEEGQQALKSALQKHMPGCLQLLIGSSNMHNFESLVVESVSNASDNQDFALKLTLSATYLMLATKPKHRAASIVY